jgi:hypothetical protein
MGLAARPVSGMSGVLMGLVHHVETLRREGFRQLLGDDIAGRHGVTLSRESRSRSMPVQSKAMANSQF